MKKIIIIIFTLAFILGGCANIDANPNTSKDISAEVSAESAESADVSFESSEAYESFEESFEDISNDASFEDVSDELSEDLSNDLSNDESKEADASSDVTDSSEESSEDGENNDTSSGDNGNESKPEDTSSSAPDVSEPDVSEPDVSEPVEDTSKPTEDVSKVETPVPHTHSYSALVYEPWCGIEGYTQYTCKCGHSYKADYTAALTHVYGNWTVIESPSTTEEGKQRRLCKICNKFEYETIPKIVVTITQADLDYMAEIGLEYLNSRRAEIGLCPLVTGPIAHQMASERAKQLSEYFSHSLPNGGIAGYAVYAKYMYNPDKAGIPFNCGENIAKSHSYLLSQFVDKENDLTVTGRGMISGFETSPGHWSDLMSEDYTACGIGYYIEQLGIGDYNIYVCVMTMDKLYGTDAK